jgi:hypothetical protein
LEDDLKISIDEQAFLEPPLDVALVIIKQNFLFCGLMLGGGS